MNDNRSMRFNGNKLRELRIKEGISQEELGKKVFVSRSTIAQYENSKATPPKETITLLADFFGVDKLIFINNDNETKKNWFKRNWKYIIAPMLMVSTICTTVSVLIAYDKITPRSLYAFCNIKSPSIDSFSLVSPYIPDGTYTVPQNKYDDYLDILKEIKVKKTNDPCRCGPICSFQFTLKNKYYYQLEGYLAYSVKGNLVNVTYLELLNRNLLLTFLEEEFGE